MGGTPAYEEMWKCFKSLKKYGGPTWLRWTQKIIKEEPEVMLDWARAMKNIPNSESQLSLPLMIPVNHNDVHERIMILVNAE